MPRPTPLLRGADFLGTQRVQVASVPVQRYYVYYRADAWRYWIPYGPYTRLADAQAAASSFQAAGYESFVR